MTQLVKDRLPDLVTVVERVVEVVVPATSYQVEIAGGTPEDVQQQKAAIKPKGPRPTGSGSYGSDTNDYSRYSAYSYNSVDWHNWGSDAPKPPGWVVL